MILKGGRQSSVLLGLFVAGPPDHLPKDWFSRECREQSLCQRCRINELMVATLLIQIFYVKYSRPGRFG